MMITIGNVSQEISNFSKDVLLTEYQKLTKKLSNMEMMSDEEVELYVVIEQELKNRLENK